MQSAYKPGSVEDNHLSRPPIAGRFKRISIGASGSPIYTNLLAADRVYLLHTSPCVAAVSYTTTRYATLRLLPGHSRRSERSFHPYHQSLQELEMAVSFLWHFP